MAACTFPRPTATMTISNEERAFFMALGERITQLRKARGMTQTQLAETLGVSQQTIQAYEVGRRRIQVSALPVVARILSVSLEELFGAAEQAAPRWQQQIEAISKLPETQQRFVAQVLDAVIERSQLKRKVSDKHSNDKQAA